MWSHYSMISYSMNLNIVDYTITNATDCRQLTYFIQVYYNTEVELTVFTISRRTTQCYYGFVNIMN